MRTIGRRGSVGGAVKRYLFVCSQNRLRSPTAEQVFAQRPGVEVASAGTNRGADEPLTAEPIEWADVVVAMGRVHRARLQRDFRRALGGRKIVCLDIPDDHDFMDPALVALPEARMRRHWPD